MQIRQELDDLVRSDKVKFHPTQKWVVRTNVYKYTKFYPAIEEHQQYFKKNPNAHCSHKILFDWNDIEQMEEEGEEEGEEMEEMRD